ncbi:hypothetical protein P8631_11455 (plasmid) [Guyparkeria sp. 1SP6A2]|nr:hypothetical protein [Guyparkeria sp. 1SP6A2]
MNDKRNHAQEAAGSIGWTEVSWEEAERMGAMEEPALSDEAAEAASEDDSQEG